MEPGDEVPFPTMPPEGVEELTDDIQDKQNALKQEGAEALEDGKKELALEKFSEAIGLGCVSAMLIAKRGQLLLQMDRPRAAVNDCNAALAINPDSAKAFKTRARAYLKLEMLEEAHFDFQTALKIDFDDQTEEDSKEVAAKVKEMQTAKTTERVKEEQAEYHRKLKESGDAYKAGLKANEEKFREERMKEEEEKRQKEDERKARVQKRETEEKEAEADKEGESGVPKSHAPPGSAAEDAEDVD